MKNEKEQLSKAAEFISMFYQQIYSSICNFRENLFTSAFPSNQDWKFEIKRTSDSISFPDINLQSIQGKLQNNSNLLFAIVNNIHAIENNYLPRIDELSLQDMELVQKFNKSIVEFLNQIFIKENTIVLTKQRLEIAKSIKTGIINNMQNNILNFWNRLQDILQDEYIIKLRPALKTLIGSQKEYMADPFNYDRLIKHKVAELGVHYDHELLLGMIADLSKENEKFYDEIKIKYEKPQETNKPRVSYRLKEIAMRYLGQGQNISSLENFVYLVYDVFQPLSFFQRLINTLRKLFTGKTVNFPKKDIIFTYTLERGPIDKKKSSIEQLIKEIKTLKEFLSRFKKTYEFYKYTKVSHLAKQNEFENIIDNSVSSLESIYIQCQGLKNWLSAKENGKYLKKISFKDQEDFNNILLSINYNNIINKQALREYQHK
ncbi:MAG: hypothetical protein JXR70_18980 [Spirochaetales bacterium]|nr:hypothetical protein [Spirochaetales bacterium]